MPKIENSAATFRFRFALIRFRLSMHMLLEFGDTHVSTFFSRSLRRCDVGSKGLTLDFFASSVGARRDGYGERGTRRFFRFDFSFHYIYPYIYV